MKNPGDFSDYIFRGYDIRGVVGKDLDEEVMELIGKGYGTFLSRRRINEAVVGMDNRLTSSNYKNAFVNGLRNCGVNVLDFGLGMSQIMYFAQYYFRTKGGAFISASHNSKEYNGVKLAVGFSQTMVTEEIDELRKITKSGKYSYFGNKMTKGKYKKVVVFPAYLNDLLKRVSLTKNFKIVVDGCNAAAGYFMPLIFKKANCKVIEQNTELDGNFPNGTPDPTARIVQERLAKGVIKEKADLGFSYDADGDRVGIVDEKGNLIWNDNLVSIFAKDILEFLPGSKIVFNTLCSKQVSEVIKTAGGIPVMWLTGHSFIKAKVAEERASFGGELSGHFFFADNFYGHDDGAFSSLRLLSYLARKNKTLSEVVAELPKYFSSPEIKLGCPDTEKFALVEKEITNDLKKFYSGAEFTEIDGVRLDTQDEMAIIRASQNGPYLTVKFEAKNKEKYTKMKILLNQILKKYPQIDFSSGVNIESLN